MKSAKGDVCYFEVGAMFDGELVEVLSAYCMPRRGRRSNTVMLTRGSYALAAERSISTTTTTTTRESDQLIITKKRLVAAVTPLFTALQGIVPS